MDPIIPEFRRSLISSVAASGPEKVLEVGAEGGFAANPEWGGWMPRQIDVVSLNRQALLLFRREIGARIEGVSLHQHSPLKFLEGRTASYDAAVTAFSFCQFEEGEQRALCEKIALALRPGGAFVLGVAVATADWSDDRILAEILKPYWLGYLGRDPFSCEYRRGDVLPTDRLLDLLRESGFRNAEVSWAEGCLAVIKDIT